MSKTVYIVNMLCPDDEDSTQISGVYDSRAKASAAVAEMEEDGLDADIEEWKVA